MRSYTNSYTLWIFWLTSMLTLIKLGTSYPEDQNSIVNRLFVGQRCVTKAGKQGFCQKGIFPTFYG